MIVPATTGAICSIGWRTARLKAGAAHSRPMPAGPEQGGRPRSQCVYPDHAIPGPSRLRLGPHGILHHRNHVRRTAGGRGKPRYEPRRGCSCPERRAVAGTGTPSSSLLRVRRWRGRELHRPARSISGRPVPDAGWAFRTELLDRTDSPGEGRVGVHIPTLGDATPGIETEGRSGHGLRF